MSRAVLVGFLRQTNVDHVGVPFFFFFLLGMIIELHFLLSSDNKWAIEFGLGRFSFCFFRCVWFAVLTNRCYEIGIFMQFYHF